jgi:hypothetical protein
MSKEEDKLYLEQKYAALNYSNSQFDKNVLFIASGALGISFAFIEKIIPNLKVAVCSKLLILSWYFFAGVIFISLVAHFISVLAQRWAIENCDCENFDSVAKRWNYTIRCINFFMIAGLLAGIILLINFVKHNI